MLDAARKLFFQDYTHVFVTILRLIAAVAFSMLLGIVFGVVMGMLPAVRPYLRALVIIDTGVPALSWMLIAIFWFKDPETRIFFILVVILLPFYALNVYEGIRALPKDLLDMIESFRPTRWQVMRYLVGPHIVQYIFLTTKSVIGYAIRMTIFAELIASAIGVGSRMGLAHSNFHIDQLLAWTFFLIALSLIAASRHQRGREALPALAAGAGGPMSAAVIELADVRKTFGSVVAVDDIGFEVARGEIVALLGRTGAGKTTVLNIVMGTIPADRGTVRVAGVDPYLHFRELRGKLAVSFQNDRLLPWRTAVENVELGLLILGRSKEEAREIATAWLARVDLAGAEGKYLHELSGGMRQRVSLARALAVDPEIVLLDESFSQLDHVTSQTLRRDFTRIAREWKKTCLLVTHRIDDALEMADRILVLHAPASVALVLKIDPVVRADRAALRQMHAQITAAMGSDEGQEPGSAAAE